jgi:hypothetical protein
MTFAPDDASEAAIALPMPFEAPVTSATLPSSEMSMAAEARPHDLRPTNR